MPRFDLPLDELRRYRPEVAEPHDFDEFWRGTVEESRSRATAVKRTSDRGILELVDVDDVTFSGFSGDPVRAWFVRPRGIDQPIPAVVEFVGYGRGRGLAHERLHWSASGFAHLIVDTRGQGSQWGVGGQTHDPHGSGPAAPGYLTRGIDDPAQYYYRRVFADAVRAVDTIRSFAEVDATRVAVTGNSQGGIIAIAAAGLSEQIVGALPSAPILCNVSRAIGFTGDDPHAEISRYLAVHRGSEERVFSTLSYFDGVNFAKRASAPALFGAGHFDTISPPSTVYAAANSWAAGAEVVDYPWNGHEGGEGAHQVRQVEWLKSRLGA